MEIEQATQVNGCEEKHYFLFASLRGTNSFGNDDFFAPIWMCINSLKKSVFFSLPLSLRIYWKIVITARICLAKDIYLK